MSKSSFHDATDNCLI